MATVEEVVRDLLAAVSTDVGYLAAVRWVDSRYQQLLSKVRFKQQRKVGAVSIPARYTTGTVTATRDSTSVTGSGTAWDTTPGNGTQEDWWIRIRSAWYRVSSITNDTTLVLADNFAEEDTSGASYDLVKRTHALDASARWLGNFLFSRLRINMGPPVSLAQLDMEAPGRTLSGGYPVVCAQWSDNSSGVMRVEMYPYSDTSEIIHYVYWDLPSTLTITTTLPKQIDSYVLKEGALCDLYRYLKSKAYQAGKIDEGNSWRNDEMTAETRWKNYIQDAVRTDSGVDDATFILTTYPGASIRSGDIRNAQDYVLNEWSWPQLT